MREKIKGFVLAAAGIVGMVSVAINFNSHLFYVALFVIFALFAADGVATITAEHQREKEEETDGSGE